MRSFENSASRRVSFSKCVMAQSFTCNLTPRISGTAKWRAFCASQMRDTLTGPLHALVIRRHRDSSFFLPDRNTADPTTKSPHENKPTGRLMPRCNQARHPDILPCHLEHHLRAHAQRFCSRLILPL